MSRMKWALYVAVALAAIVLIFAIFSFLGGFGERRAESQYTGHVVDVVEDKGLVFTPSWVNMKTDARSSDIQKFCVHPDDEEELLPELYDAMESGDRYTVTYSRPLWVGPWDCDTNQAILSDVRAVNGSGGA